MESIAQILNNGKAVLDGVTKFVHKRIGSKLMHKCHIEKIDAKVTSCKSYEYADTPLSRLIGPDVEASKYLKKCVPAMDLLIDTILVGFHSFTPSSMFKNDNYFREYGKDTYYRFYKDMESANWERLQVETTANVISEINSETTEKSHYSSRNTNERFI